MIKFTKHTIEEFESMTDEAFETLSRELYALAVSLGIKDISKDDSADYLQELIDLRLKPVNKMGFSVSPSTSLSKDLRKINGSIEKLRVELIRTISNWADGEIVFKKAVSIEDKYGQKIKVSSIFCECFEEDDEKEILCQLKSAPKEYDNGYGIPVIPLQNLPMNSIMKLSDAILEGAKVYSKEECMELVERKRK